MDNSALTQQRFAGAERCDNVFSVGIRAVHSSNVAQMLRNCDWIEAAAGAPPPKTALSNARVLRRTLHAAIKAGLGIAPVSPIGLADEIAAGTAERLLPAFQGSPELFKTTLADFLVSWKMTIPSPSFSRQRGTRHHHQRYEGVE